MNHRNHLKRRTACVGKKRDYSLYARNEWQLFQFSLLQPVTKLNHSNSCWKSFPWIPWFFLFTTPSCCQQQVCFVRKSVDDVKQTALTKQRVVVRKFVRELTHFGSVPTSRFVRIIFRLHPITWESLNCPKWLKVSLVVRWRTAEVGTSIPRQRQIRGRHLVAPVRRSTVTIFQRVLGPGPRWGWLMWGGLILSINDFLFLTESKGRFWSIR